MKARRRLRSLRIRLLIGATLAIAAALGMAGIGLQVLSAHTIHDEAMATVREQFRALVADVDVGAGDQLQVMDEPRDPRFALPYGGFYWQIGRGSKVELRSQSLWDQTLPWLPQDGEPPGAHLVGPNDTRLVAMQRSVVLSTPDGDETVRVLVALDWAAYADARRAFFYAMAPSLAVLTLALIAAVWLFLRVGLRPLDDLRLALMKVRDRSAQLIEGAFPSEVQPLVDDLNALITARDGQLVAARSRAGDLAHGLKTPLAVLEAVARDLEAAGDDEHARQVRDEVGRMEAHVRRALAQARAGLAAAQMNVSVDAARSTRRLVETMRRLSTGRRLEITLAAPPALALAVDETDFMEIAGNLIDNARKWAAARVAVRLVPDGRRAILEVADDGPGLPPDWDTPDIARGRRLDESVGGTGFGLAIVRDLVEAYGGRLVFTPAPAGGLVVLVELPAAGQFPPTQTP
ncbi:HAMP domain-containing sensor histidine kinase [Pseudoxanthobacter sp.]|uniref:sensor histidine kinase n=1 Tax=Pseudoxanthobacter sp. TaxID=1925742 RepID=UPI002FE0901C